MGAMFLLPSIDADLLIRLEATHLVKLQYN